MLKNIYDFLGVGNGDHYSPKCGIGKSLTACLCLTFGTASGNTDPRKLVHNDLREMILKN